MEIIFSLIFLLTLIPSKARLQYSSQTKPNCLTERRRLISNNLSPFSIPMNSWHIQSCIFSNPSSRTLFPVTCYSKRQTAPKITRTHQAIPARDKIIDFGKYKGRMLGTLPSSYLKWVSKNLRAQDFEEWAKLADQVLQDPIYNDRIEWELAAYVLNGNQLKTPSSATAESSTAVAELLEISERFGWDNNDKAGWKNINFELLGTSKGGRIPRLNKVVAKNNERDMVNKQKEPNFKQRVSEDEVRRSRRRERLKMRRETQTVVGELGIKGNSRGSFVNHTVADDSDTVCRPGNTEEDDGYDEMVQRNNGNPFPGREALLRKALNRRGLVS